jgi:hypothetical protein
MNFRLGSYGTYPHCYALALQCGPENNYNQRLKLFLTIKFHTLSYERSAKKI